VNVKLVIALIAASTIAVASSLLFLIQGGFGGGHGKFDFAIGILGLPWVALISKDSVISRMAFSVGGDFLWLIGFPFLLNVISVLAIKMAVQLLRISVVNRR